MNGLQLLSVSSIGTRSRALKGQARLRSDASLLLGSAVGDVKVEDVVGALSTPGVGDATSSVFVQAIVASPASSGGRGAVTALVRMARSSAVTARWLDQLTAAGIPVTKVEVVSLDPYAPSTVEAQLQGKLKLLREEIALADTVGH